MEPTACYALHRYFAQKHGRPLLWIISIAMVYSTVFFLMESTSVGHHWKTSLNVGALVTLVAAVHYFYMRELWVQIGSSPIVYGYIDWSITVPLQMVQFYLIISAVQTSLKFCSGAY